MRNHDALLVNCDDHRHDGDFQLVKRVLNDWPFKLTPLLVKLGAFGMLFLNNTNYFKLAFINPSLPLGIPTWNPSSTARSPRSEMNQQNLLATVLAKRDVFSRLNVR